MGVRVNHVLKSLFSLLCGKYWRWEEKIDNIGCQVTDDSGSREGGGSGGGDTQTDIWFILEVRSCRGHWRTNVEYERKQNRRGVQGFSLRI